MHLLSIEALEADAEAFDEAVLRTPEIDRFCSSSAWILPASRALSGPRCSFIHRGEHGWLLAMRGESAAGVSFIEPLEATWGMACPLIGPDPQALAQEAAAVLAENSEWQMLLLSGMPMEGALLSAFLRALPRGVLHRPLELAVRRIASLEGGVDGFLSRRSRNFRKALRAAERDAREAGISFEPVRVACEADAVRTYARILEIEARSWKGAEGVGIDQGPMRRFYAEMVLHLSRHGRQRTWFARQGELDVAYCLGAVFDGQYRGLQFSFDRAFARHSLGSLLQLRQIEALVAEGVRRYDLGQDLEYKRRWGEEAFETATLLVFRP